MAVSNAFEMGNLTHQGSLSAPEFFYLLFIYSLHLIRAPQHSQHVQIVSKCPEPLLS